MTETTDTAPDDASRQPAPPLRICAVRRGAIVRLPSARATAALAAAMLALGVAIGAAIGPAPNASFAGASRLLGPALTALAGSGSHGPASSPSAQPPAAAAPPAPAAAGVAGAPAHASSSRPSSAAASPKSKQNASTPSSAPTGAGQGSATSTLPPVTHVWLVELSGTSFAEALAAPSAAPYIDGQAIPSGTLLSGWSALEASAFASDAALIASTPPQLLDTIVQPPCPEGAGTSQCVIGTPAALTAADDFLKATVPTIAASAAYHSNGLIVITFGSVVSASNAGLPNGAANATLTSSPPSGVLLISPFASAGARQTISFNPASPRQSLEKLLHK